MKKMNKKGFTIVELVIVIAVIAILAAVMIPTFSNVVSNAKEAAALQKARNIHTQYLADINYAASHTIIEDGYIVADGYTFAVVDGVLNAEPVSSAAGTQIVFPAESEEE